MSSEAQGREAREGSLRGFEQESLDKSDLQGRKAGEAFQAEGDTNAHMWGQTDPLQESQDVCVRFASDRREDETLGGEDLPLSQPADAVRAPSRTHSPSP